MSATVRACVSGITQDGMARRGVLAVGVLVALALAGVLPAAASAAECPNEAVRKVEAEQDSHALALPDCRAYEQVSPVEKNFTDAIGSPGTVQASPSGDAVTFFSISPFPGTLGASDFPTYLSKRVNGDWATEGLLPPSDPNSEAGILALTENLSNTLLRAREPLLTSEGEGAVPGHTNFYVRNNATGKYRFLAGPAGVVHFVGATGDDSKIFFEDKAKLTENAVAGVPNLYAWNGSSINLVGVLEGGEAPEGEGTVAGAGGEAIEEVEEGLVPTGEAGFARGGAASNFYTAHAVSENGSVVFYTDTETGQIYMREPEAKRTIAVSAGTKPAYWRDATPDGSYALYTEGQHSSRNLWRFGTKGDKREAITSGSPTVLGTLGMSNDGSYIYFVAKGSLTTTPNSRGEVPVIGAANLYEWHEGSPSQTTFIASLSISSDISDWLGFCECNGLGPAGGGKTSRVSPSGATVIFTSTARLTDYNNDNHVEVYLLNEPSHEVVCVSCRVIPKEVPAETNAYLTQSETLSAPAGRNVLLPRNLAAEGSRVFFQTKEALLPQDTNSQMDVYEWEAEGTGDCLVEDANENGGCLSLISTGTSTDASYFGDASENGDNVFFFTRQSLVKQDDDSNADIYDAHEGGGLESQNAVPPSLCEGEGCRGSSSSAPVFGAPSSTAFSGSGNLAPPVQEPKRVLKPKPKTLTRTQKFAQALKACGRKPRRQRAGCRAQARKRYGTKAKKGDRGGK